MNLANLAVMPTGQNFLPISMGDGKVLHLPFNPAAATAQNPFAGFQLSGARDQNGKVIQLTLDPSDVRLPEEMSTYLAGYSNWMFRADEMSPVVMVDDSEGKYRTMSSTNAFQRVPVKGSLNGRVNMIDPSSSLADYKTSHRYLGTFINDVVEREAKSYRPRQEGLQLIKDKIFLDREYDVITLVTTAANWATNQKVTLGAGFEWNGGANSNPIIDLQTRKLASGQPAWEIWMNEVTANWFISHPIVRDFMKQMVGDRDNPQLAAAMENEKGLMDFRIPGVGTIKISSARALNETTGENELMWPTGVVAILATGPGVPADGHTIQTTKTFRTKGPQGTGYGTREFRIEAVGPEGGTVLVVHQSDVAVMSGNNIGGLILNAVQ